MLDFGPWLNCRAARVQEMLHTLIIGAAAVVAFICPFAMFLQYMREDAENDGNSYATGVPRRGRTSIGDARSWRGINDGSFLSQAVLCLA